VKCDRRQVQHTLIVSSLDDDRNNRGTFELKKESMLRSLPDVGESLSAEEVAAVIKMKEVLHKKRSLHSKLV